MYEHLSQSTFPTSGSILDIEGVGKLIGWGTTLPTGTGYAKGALFFKHDGTVDNRLYVNEGDATTASFTEVGSVG